MMVRLKGRGKAWLISGGVNSEKTEVRILMGNFNAVVCEGQIGIVGKYGLGKRDPIVQRLVDFCNQHSIVVGNWWLVCLSMLVV